MKQFFAILVVVIGLMVSSSADAVPMYGTRTVYFNAGGRVVGLEVNLCKPGGNKGNALQAGVTSQYLRRDETVCSGQTTRWVCGEVSNTTVCGFEAVDVGYGVYATQVNLPPGLSLSDSNAVYQPDGINYPEIWSVGIENVKADILNSGGTWSDI
jgi:hypothetical protein